jgi:hypothetical protein
MNVRLARGARRVLQHAARRRTPDELDRRLHAPSARARLGDRRADRLSRDGTDKLTYLCSKSGYSEKINQTIDIQCGTLSSISGQSNSLCVDPAHGLELTCQYRNAATNKPTAVNVPITLFLNNMRTLRLFVVLPN